jgi:hypothetical protein
LFHVYLKKWFFWPPKHCCPLHLQEKNLFFNSECYDLINDKEQVSKIWWTYKLITRFHN